MKIKKMFKELKEIFKESPVNGLFVIFCYGVPILIIIGFLVLGLIRIYYVVSGNKQIIDTSFDFNRAVIELPNGEIVDGEINSWRDYEDGDQLQIIMEDGKVYLTSTYHCTLIKDN